MRYARVLYLRALRILYFSTFVVDTAVSPHQDENYLPTLSHSGWASSHLGHIIFALHYFWCDFYKKPH